MPVVKRTFYGYVRSTAYDLWIGPDYVENVENVEKEDEDKPLGGYCVLRLDIRKGETAKPMIESRAAYALFIPDEPQDALLRAVYWDDKAIGATTHSTPLDTPFKIAAKFVHLPLTLLNGWIVSLQNLQTTIQTTSYEDDNLPICSLRVETDSVSSLFEKTWQVVEGENAQLNRAWWEIWQQMGQVLQTSPALTNIRESFPCIKGKPDVYDLHAYQPSLNLP
jgi:hypothetical protein